MTPAGVVLTGGRSSRMGADKALLTVGGVALAKRVADALAGGGCDPVVCQGGDVDALVALGLSARPDSKPGAGPLTAILDALTSFAPADVVVSACDLPGVDAGTIAHLLSVAAGHPTAGVVVAHDHDGPHLVGVWRAATRSPLVGPDRCRSPVVSRRPRPARCGVRQRSGKCRGQRQQARRPALMPVGFVAMAIPEITVDDLAERLAAGAPLVDVREQVEYDEAHVGGAVLVPLATVPDNLDAFRSDGPTYVICKSGGRSMKACEFVAGHGIEVVNVAGGTLAWLMSGREYVSGAA